MKKDAFSDLTRQVSMIKSVSVTKLLNGYLVEELYDITGDKVGFVYSNEVDALTHIVIRSCPVEDEKRLRRNIKMNLGGKDNGDNNSKPE